MEGQLQFMICHDPASLEEAKKTMASEPRQIRLAKDRLDCFRKDNQVHIYLLNVNTVEEILPFLSRSAPSHFTHTHTHTHTHTTTTRWRWNIATLFQRWRRLITMNQTRHHFISSFQPSPLSYKRRQGRRLKTG